MAMDRNEVAAALRDRYRLKREIGRGASAVVFEAEDLRLERSVAIKVLEPDLARTIASEHFMNEVRIEARLQHPHILPLLDSGSAGGFLFCVTPLVTGTTLRERLEREGGLPTDMALRLGEEIARALEHAHSHGVVHRDIKPENVLLSDEQAILCDFGIARALSESADGRLTTAGIAIGTPLYMSPEQVEGIGPPDPRSDLYSLGCVLYEMLTGRPPFSAPTAGGILRQHLQAVVPPVSTARPGVPRAFEALVERCMAKDPTVRPASAAELADAIARIRIFGATARLADRGFAHMKRPDRMTVAGFVLVVAVGAWLWPIVTTPRDSYNSLVVLPLENLTGDRGQEYFVDGMTDALINSLSRIRKLRVISRTSAMALKESDEAVPVLARRLGVGAVVEGSVVRSRDRIRISVQLLRADPEKTLWSESYERDAGDIVTLQGEVARDIAKAVRAHMTPEEQQRIDAPAHTLDPRMYESYLRGQHLLHTRFDVPSYRRAKAEFEGAIERDPTYAPAWAGLADAYYNLSSVDISPELAMPRARAAALRALMIDSTLAEAHVIVGLVSSQYELDWVAAERSLRRAVDLNPGSPFAHWALSMMLDESGQLAEAVRERQRAAELDPLSQYYAVGEGMILFKARRFGEARTIFQRVLDEHPENGPAASGLGAVYEAEGRLDSAAVFAERAVASSGYFLSQLGRVQARAGNTAEARRTLARMWLPESFPHGLIRFQLGQKDSAFVLFEAALEARDENFIAAFPNDPNWSEIRADPRGRELLRRMGLAAEGSLQPKWSRN